MPKALLAVPSFTAGELSPRMEGRTDFQKYYSAATIINNFVVQPHGPVARRPGTYFVSEVKDSANETRLIPFSFSTQQTYILEFGNLYIRFYKDQGQIVSGGSAYEIASPYTSAQVEQIKFAQSADIMYLCHPDHPTKKLSRTGHTSWTITNVTFRNGPFEDENITDTIFTASAIKGTITITANSTVGINNGSGFVSTDIGRLIHVGQENGNAIITAINSTTSVAATVTDDQPLSTTTPGTLAKDISASDTTIPVDGADSFPTSGTILVENEYISYTGKNGEDLTGATRAVNGSSAAAHKAGIRVYNNSITPTTEWSLGYFSETTSYPKTVSFFEQRLVFAGSTTSPQTIWFSKSGDYENFSAGTNDDNAMIYTIASNQVNAIQSIKSTRTLIVMTTGGEFTVSSGTGADAVTPTNINIRKQSTYGSSGVDAIAIGNATVFVQRAKRKLRELAYNFDSDSYVAPDLVILAEHITYSGIKYMDYQQEPFSIVWCVRNDGKLIGMTYNRLQDVVAWHSHNLGGTDAKVKSISIIDNDGTEDEVWLIVERTINGSTKKYIEYMTPYDFDSNLEQFHFVDSGLSYSGAATSTISGLNHLEGQTVAIITNGATHPDKVVSGGAITLDRTATNVKVGLNYVSTLQTMRLDEGYKGTDQTKTKRIYDVALRFYETVGAKVGPNETNLEEIPFRDSSASMSAPVPLFSGDKEIEFPSDYGTDGFVLVKQEQALPMTILAIYPRLETWND